jgi:hypothetical protein
MLPIEVSHLVVAYRRWFKPPFRAVDDLSFVVREGGDCRLSGRERRGQDQHHQDADGLPAADSGRGAHLRDATRPTPAHGNWSVFCPKLRSTRPT